MKNETEKTIIVHNIPPVYDKNSKILILGSFPSVKSREEKFFYGHAQNRFWKVIASVFKSDVPHTVEEKRRFLISNCIAVWDVIESCEITGSADSSIKNVRPNDINKIIHETNVSQIFVNGKTAEKYYKKYISASVGKNAVCLPSTSPANAAWTLDKLIEEWRRLILPGVT